MSSFNNIFAEQYYLKGELIDFKGQQGPPGENGTDGKDATIVVDGTETVIHGEDGKDATVEFKKIEIVEGMGNIILPDPSTLPEYFGLYYYKTSLTESNTSIIHQNGDLAAKFYYHRYQHCKFVKCGDVWI